MKLKKIIGCVFLIFIINLGAFLVYVYISYYPPILMYHSIGNYAGTPCVNEDAFRKQMIYLKENGFKVLDLTELAYLIKQRKVPRKTVAITFDDGYKNNMKAVEVLKEFNFPATIFVTVNSIGKDDFLSEADIRFILSETPVVVGSHCLNHRYLPGLSLFELQKEIFLSKKLLENKFNAEIKSIAYPSGGFNNDVARTVREAGYVCGLTTLRGSGRNLFALKRVKISSRNLGLSFWCKLSGYVFVFKNRRNPY